MGYRVAPRAGPFKGLLRVYRFGFSVAFASLDPHISGFEAAVDAKRPKPRLRHPTPRKTHTRNSTWGRRKTNSNACDLGLSSRTRESRGPKPCLARHCVRLSPYYEKQPLMHPKQLVQRGSTGDAPEFWGRLEASEVWLRV